MPNKPKHPCSHPGCSALIDAGRYCEAHQRTAPDARTTYDQTTRKQTPELAEAKRIRSSARWTKTSRLVKSCNPLCCDPFKLHGIGALTEHAHHVIGLAIRPDLAFDLRNLAPLCEACHTRTEGMERAGQSTAQLFDGVEVVTPFGSEMLYGSHPPACDAQGI